MELAYAVTVHKAQGGEAKRVVLALSPQHGRLLTRRLLYTGLTRAKELLVVVAPGGSTDPIVTAVGRQESDDRLSSLRSRLEAQVEARGLKPQTPVVFSNEDDVLGDMVAPAPMNPAAALSALCSRLGVDEPTAALLQALPALSEAPLVSVETVRTHLQMLERHRGDEARKLSVSEVLSTAPLLLVSAPESFDRCFSWCQKLGPAEGELHGDADGNNSLVDQLRRLLATQ